MILELARQRDSQRDVQADISTIFRGQLISGIHVQLLGSVAASIHGKHVELGPPRERSLFAVLAAHAHREVSRQEIIEAVWGAEAPATVESSVYTYVAGLRRRFEPARGARAPARLLVNSGSGYMLTVDPAQVDTVVFERHVAAARQQRSRHQYDEAVAEFDAALALWRGTAYGGAPGPFAEAERSRLDELRCTAVEDRAELLLVLHRSADVVGELTTLARKAPLRERTRYLLMVALHRSGRQADALAEFRAVRSVLISELGIEPGEELQRTHEQILRGYPDVILRTRGVAPPMQEGGDAVPAVRTVPGQLPRDVPGFTGRTGEVALLHELVGKARESAESGLVLVSGGPGTGKTALTVHFAHKISTRFPDGQLYVDLRGFSAEEPMPSDEALGHLLTDLGEAGTPPANLERRSALYRSLLADKSVLVVLDNAESAEQVRPLLPGSSSSLVMVTSRNQMPGLTAHDGAQRILVAPLPENEAVALISTISGERVQHQDPGELEQLVRACGLLPVALRLAAERIVAADYSGRAVTEVVRSIIECPELLTRSAEDDGPVSIGAMFSWSYRLLPHEAARLFRLIGIHRGDDISPSTASVLVGTGLERARDLLGTLVRANLMRELRGRYGIDQVLHSYAKQMCEEVDLPSERAQVQQRLLSFYLHRAQSVVAILTAEWAPSPNGETSAVCQSCELHTVDEAIEWFEAELSSLMTAIEHAGATGADKVATQISQVIRDYLRLRDERCPIHPADEPDELTGRVPP